MFKYLFTIAVSLSLAQFAAAQTESNAGATEKVSASSEASTQ
jgi:hypothetical protein